MATNEVLATVAARYWSDLWRDTNPNVSEDTLTTFRESLVTRVRAELDERERFNSMPGEGGGRGNCKLVCDYDPFEPLLSAIRAAGVECRGSMFSAKSIFPCKHRMFIEDGGIRVVEGYGARDRFLDLSSETP